MRWHFIISMVGILIIFLGMAMIFPLLCGIYYHDASVKPLAVSILLSVLFGGSLYWGARKENSGNISHREGMAIVTFAWVSIGLFGALPFYLGEMLPTFTDAMFESVSGFTTTGASVLTDIESVPKGLLFWRSFIQWLGGMGIIVLSVAILPFLGVGGMQLYKAEVPSPVPDKLKPRVRDTAKILWKVYLLITIFEVVLLLFGGMTLFDSLCHTFTTMPTGGFSTKNTSVAHFNSSYIDMVIALFMLLAGINFSLHFQIIKGNTLAFWKDAECRFFLCVVLVLTVLVSLDIYGSVYQSAWESFRYGLFQVVSIVTTTGYATADYELWPGMSQIIIFFCMFLGASAGSTGGGMKCIRIMLCMKYCYKEIFSLIHPRSISHVKISGKVIPEDVVRSVLGFVALYLALFVFCSILLAGTGVDFLTAISAVASAIGNIGPGFGMVGPVENYAPITATGKWILIWCMLIGRLEVYTVIILLAPEFWRK